MYRKGCKYYKGFFLEVQKKSIFSVRVLKKIGKPKHPANVCDNKNLLRPLQSYEYWKKEPLLLITKSLGLVPNTPYKKIWLLNKKPEARKLIL